jgi:hypothetical protein
MESTTNSTEFITSRIVPGQNSGLQARYGNREAAPVCTRTRDRGINYLTGEILEERCRTHACRYCTRLKVKDLTRAISLARPSHFMTMTGLSGTWCRDREAIKVWRRYCSRSRLDLRMCFSVEPNPSSTGAHAHAWVYSSDQVDEHVMQDRATKVGLGSIDVRPVYSQQGFAYGLKMAAWNSASADAYQRVNGRALVSARGFWRNVHGQPVDQVKAIAASRWYDQAGA